METKQRDLEHLQGISDIFASTVLEIYDRFRLISTVKILVVVDGGISLTEGVSAFGVGRIVRLLRESRVGCKEFAVDLATREGPQNVNPTPALNQPRYTGFRFDQIESGQPTVDRYHQIWCFGFNPDNNAGPDSNITQSFRNPTSDDELEVLTRWMNDRRGGLLAMGDHDYLGASMCHRIPRIRSMRRWTHAQGVPPIGTSLRHDTNQPFTAGQLAGSDVIPFLAQEDTKPQPIEWVPWMTERISVFKIRQRPHPVLCHPALGPIDVMPDHPHEGWCYDDDEIDLEATYTFGKVSGDEYPRANGQQPRPMVIAYGHTTPDPPYQLAKGPSPRKRFGMVSVYDGHAAHVGRVATDSTWHHWFDENIHDIEQAGGNNWAKISRYYLNIASWLTPPGVGRWCLFAEVLATHFTYLGHQEYSRRASVFTLGKVLQSHLQRYLGPCWVSQWVFDRLELVDRDVWAALKERLFWGKGGPAPDEVCLSCPPFEALESAILGGLVRATFPIADELKEQALRTAHTGEAHVRSAKQAAGHIDADLADKLQLEGAILGLSEFRGALARSAKEIDVFLRSAAATAGCTSA
jgi:hypothetical protein